MNEANESGIGGERAGLMRAPLASMNPQGLGSLAGAPDESLVEMALAFVRGDDAAAKQLPSGETVLAHAEGSLRVVAALRVDEETCAAAVLFPVAWEYARMGRPIDGALRSRFGHEVADLVRQAGKLLAVGDKAVDGGEYLASRNDSARRMAQVEALRKMLLAFADDIRVVLVRLASRLQTLRWHAQTKQEPPSGLALETLDLYAPLANRLGIWQLKWELEDLALRFEHPAVYKQIARMLDEKRVEREAFVAEAIRRLQQELQAAGIAAEVSGRPKHIYSIWKKMRGKGLDFSELHDVRAFRVIVDDIKGCYTALGIVHNLWQPVPREFDDYISRPKPNGYKSLHTVVIGDDGRAFEVQIRTHEMHHFAEYGVAAHWRYKEAGTKGYGGQVSAAGRYDERIAWVRQLLAWRADAERTAAHPGLPEGVPTADAPGHDGAWEQLKHTELDDHIYVLTPQARIIALPQQATPVDFAYYLHSDVGHRCRGARVDGTMVPLNTALRNGQTVEIITVKQGGPSRDWLNLELGYLISPRARAKVRAWFNALELQETVAHGRALIEKTLQREGRTAVGLDELAHRLGFKNPDALFAQVAKDEFSLRHVEQALRDRPAQPVTDEEGAMVRASRATSVARGAHSGVLVLGVGSLMTNMARCCKPAPPDAIVGFVTVGKGVSIHRCACKTFAQLAARAPQRVIETQWGAPGDAVYPVDIGVHATDRQGLLRDISEVLVREKVNVTDVRTQSRQGMATMRFTAEIGDAGQLLRALNLIAEVRGVLSTWRA